MPVFFGATKLIATQRRSWLPSGWQPYFYFNGLSYKMIVTQVLISGQPVLPRNGESGSMMRRQPGGSFMHKKPFLGAAAFLRVHPATV